MSRRHRNSSEAADSGGAAPPESENTGAATATLDSENEADGVISSSGDEVPTQPLPTVTVIGVGDGTYEVSCGGMMPMTNGKPTRFPTAKAAREAAAAYLATLQAPMEEIE